MHIHFTARRFKAHESVRDHAIDSVKRLDKFYDGIVRGDVVLSYERTTNSLKTAEINLHVYGTVLFAKEKSEDFHKSIDIAVEKLERQLEKYKMRLRKKNKKQLRKVKETTVKGEEE
jgi:putative sigma-54 modulation protein